MKSCPCGDPNTRGMPSDSIESVKTSSPALTSAGRSIGSVTRPSTRSGEGADAAGGVFQRGVHAGQRGLADEEDDRHGDRGAEHGHAGHGGQVERHVQRPGDEIVRVAARPVQRVPAEDEAERREHDRRDEQARVHRRPGTSVRPHTTANPPPSTSAPAVVMAANSAVFRAAAQKAGSVNSCR